MAEMTVGEMRQFLTTRLGCTVKQRDGFCPECGQLAARGHPHKNYHECLVLTCGWQPHYWVEMNEEEMIKAVKALAQTETGDK